MKNKQFLSLVLFSAISLSVFSQRSQGGLPPSFTERNSNKLKSTPSVSNVTIDLDVDRLMWEDQMVEKNGGTVRIARVLPIEVDMQKSGAWSTLSDSTKVWQETIFAEGAKGLILSYSDFYIPEGGKLFIYNNDRSQVLGAYTKETHPQGGAFATEVIVGDKITLEYVASTVSDEQPRIAVEDVGYIYNLKAIESFMPPTKPINKSDSCMINVNCPDGDNWQTQKRGVVLLYTKVNLDWSGCSGSLINNTNRDGTPYILTADHCFRKDANVYPDKSIVYFNFEFPGCANEDDIPITTRSLVGFDILVQAPFQLNDGVTTVRGSDGALIRLKENVPTEWKPYYNGWDRRNIAPTSGVVIHHPNFDVKKITTYNRTASTDTFYGIYVGAPNGSWRVTYNGNSVTEGGSSGSPLFNQEGLIIGSLSGGSSECRFPFRPDFFGKFSFNWDYMEGPDKQLKPYLDPKNEGNLTLKGYDPNYPSGIENEVAETLPTKSLVVFPTMADNEVNINSNSIIRSLKVVDMSGRLVYSKSDNNASTTVISVDGWTKGVYSVIVETDEGKQTEKFLKK